LPVTAIGALILVALTARLAPAAHGEGRDSQAYWVVFPQRVYRQPVRKFDEVNFKNFVVDIYGPDGKCCDYSAKLANGRSVVRQVHPSFSEDDVYLGEVYYIPSGPRGRKSPSRANRAMYAVTTYSWTTIGGTGTAFEGVNLYEILHDRLVLAEQIGFNSGSHTGSHFNPATMKLTITAADSSVATGPPCCHLYVVTFKWTGNFFRKQSSKTLPYPSR
jgi:hypothetical protein